MRVVAERSLRASDGRDRAARVAMVDCRFGVARQRGGSGRCVVVMEAPLVERAVTPGAQAAPRRFVVFVVEAEPRREGLRHHAVRAVVAIAVHGARDPGDGRELALLPIAVAHRAPRAPARPQLDLRDAAFGVISQPELASRAAHHPLEPPFGVDELHADAPRVAHGAQHRRTLRDERLEALHEPRLAGRGSLEDGRARPAELDPEAAQQPAPRRSRGAPRTRPAPRRPGRSADSSASTRTYEWSEVVQPPTPSGVRSAARAEQ